MSIRKRVRTKARKALGVDPTVGKILQALTVMNEHMEAQDELLEVLVESNESLRTEIDGLKKFSSSLPFPSNRQPPTNDRFGPTLPDASDPDRQ